MVEDGLVSLDDVISKAWAPFKNFRVYKSGNGTTGFETVPLDRAITYRDLFTHSAGLVGYNFWKLGDHAPDNMKYPEAAVMTNPALAALAGIPRNGANFDEQWKEFIKIPLSWQPGVYNRYSIGIDVIGHCMSKIENKALDLIMNERILDPLGMTRTRFFANPADVAKVTVQYQNDPVTRELKPSIFSPYATTRSETSGAISGGGGLFSTIDQYQEFLDMLLGKGTTPEGKRILTAESVKAIMSNQLPDGKLLSEMDSHHKFDAPLSSGYMMYGKGVGHGLSATTTEDPFLARATSTTMPGPAGKGTYSWLGFAGTHFAVDPGNDVTLMIWSQVSFTNWFGEGRYDAFNNMRMEGDFLEYAYKALGLAENSMNW